jgi:hypothetical protein
MNNQLRLRCAWGVLAGGILLISTLPGIGRLGQAIAPYCTNQWTHFLVYAALATIPCAACRVRRGILCCFLVVGLSVVCGVLHGITAGPAGISENILSDFFGIAAGVLLGMNLRVMSASAGAGAGMPQDRRQSTTL